LKGGLPSTARWTTPSRQPARAAARPSKRGKPALIMQCDAPPWGCPAHGGGAEHSLARASGASQCFNGHGSQMRRGGEHRWRAHGLEGVLRRLFHAGAWFEGCMEAAWKLHRTFGA
jgi:hypothetical protein